MSERPINSLTMATSWWPHKMSFAWVMLLALALIFVAREPARAFTATDADSIFSAYKNAFYFTNSDGGYFHSTTEADSKKAWFWETAEEMEMLLDTYERTTNKTCLTLFSNAYNGFLADQGTDWGHNEFNDDILWMVIACARAHQLTGNPAFFNAAKHNFDLCFARAWSTNLGGGLWWKTDNRSKNACVNGPGAIAAYLLYQITADTNYLNKSEAIYKWERDTLFDQNSGRVCDNINLHGRIAYKAFTYNEGTFVGAANFLGFTNDARRATDFTRDHLSRDGILPGYGQEGDAAGFNGICVRWMARFMKDRGLQHEYQKWLQANADAAWSIRRHSDNLSWSQWSLATPDGPLYSWGCSCSVVVMQVVPPSS